MSCMDRVLMSIGLSVRAVKAWISRGSIIDI